MISSGDDYADTAKPQIDQDDQATPEGLINSRVCDAFAMSGAAVQGRPLNQRVSQAAQLLATVTGW